MALSGRLRIYMNSFTVHKLHIAMQCRVLYVRIARIRNSFLAYALRPLSVFMPRP